MSYRCGICHEVSQSGTPGTRTVLEYRAKLYDRGGGETTTGREIVRETLAHAECALKSETEMQALEEASKTATLATTERAYTLGTSEL